MLAVDGPPASSARLHNALAGDWNCTDADKAVAAELEAICPPIRQMVADSRKFTTRVVRWAGGHGVRQVIDLGAGLPPGEAVHEMTPGLRVTYVDNDGEVTDHLGVTIGGREGIAVVRACLADPEAVLSDPGLAKVIDLDQPALVLMALVLHLLPPGAAETVVREYAGRLVPGSLIAVSIPRVADADMWQRLQDVNPARAWNHGRDDLARFMGSLEPVPPGIAPAHGLRPGWETAAGCRNAAAYVLAGIGRVK